MRDAFYKDIRFRRNQSNSRDGMLRIFKANELGVGVGVVPEKERAVDRSPCIVDVGKEAKSRMHLAVVEKSKDLVGDGVG